MKYILLLTLLSACTTYPIRKYEAIDNKGKSLTVYEPKHTYNEHQHNKGDTVVIYTHHGAFGQIANKKYDGRNLSYKFKNVIITKIK